MARKPAAKFREKKQQKKSRNTEGRTAVSATELAAILANPPFSDRWLRQLADNGYLVKIGRAQYDLAGSVQGYLRFVRETEVNQASDAATSREAFEAERARKLKLENDQNEAKLIETSLAVAAVDAVVGVYQSEVHSIPARVTSDVALRREWEREIDRVSDGINQRCRQAVANLAAGRNPLDDAGEDDT